MQIAPSLAGILVTIAAALLLRPDRDQAEAATMTT